MTVVDEAFLQSTAAIFPRLRRAEYTLFFLAVIGCEGLQKTFSFIAGFDIEGMVSKLI